MTSTDEHPTGYSTVFSRIVSLIVALVGGVVLLGWWLDIAALKSIFPELVSMKVNTAIGVLLCAVALALLSRKRVGKPVDYLAAVLALVVMALGGLTLCQYLLGWDLRMDQWLFGEVQRSEGTSHPGRMSPASALCFVFTGAALLVASLPVGLRLRQASVAALSATVTGLGILALAGYLLEAGLGYHIWNYTGTAVHAATSFILLGCGLLALVRSEGGLAWSLDTRTTVGFIAAIVLMITVAGSSYNFAKQQQQTAIRVSHTQEVLKGLENVKSDLAGIESSQRGYIITGAESLRQRFVQAQTQLPVSLDTVRRLIADDANQQQRLKQLEALLSEHIDFAEQTLAARQQQGFAAAQQLVATGKGIALTDSLNRLLKAMQDEGQALLEANQQQSAATSVTTFLLLPLEVFLSLAMLSLGLFFLNAGVAEQAQAERAMEHSEARMAGIVNSAMDAIISVNGEQKIILFNSAAEKIFRCPAAKALGQEIQTFIPQRFHQQHRQHVQDFGQTGVTSRSMRALGILSGLRSDGEEFPLEASISQIEVAGQKIFTVILRDITERKQAEVERQKFVSLAENSIEFIGMCDLQGNPFFVNAAGLRLVGLDNLEQALQTPVTEFFFPQDRPFIAEQFLPKVQREGQGEVEIRFRHFKTGAALWMIYNVFVIRDVKAQPVGFATVSRDITERKQAQEALQNSEHRFRTLIEHSSDSISLIDKDNQILYLSPAVKTVEGYTPEELLGRNGIEHTHPDDLLLVNEIVQRLLANPGKPIPVEWRRRHKNGQWIWLEGFATNLLDDPAIRAIVTNYRDITERKQAEEAILRLNAELEQRVLERTTQLTAVNKELEAFSYSVSHDLRAPLRHINGFSQALLEDYADKLDEEGRSYLHEVRNATQEMAHLIDDVLQLARVTRSEMHNGAVNLSEAVLEVLAQLKNRDPKRQVALEVEEGLWVQGDKRLLQIMLRNLLENAWKFTSKRELSEIAFRQQKKNGETVYFVRDNGAGFDMAYADKLFGAFQRLHNATEFEGTGVGLAIVQRIILRHGGQVWAEAAVNEGATFYFRLASFTQE